MCILELGQVTRKDEAERINMPEGVSEKGPGKDMGQHTLLSILSIVFFISNMIFSEKALLGLNLK